MHTKTTCTGTWIDDIRSVVDWSGSKYVFIVTRANVVIRSIFNLTISSINFEISAVYVFSWTTLVISSDLKLAATNARCQELIVFSFFVTERPLFAA